MDNAELDDIADRARMYVFHRDNMFYPIHIPEGDKAVPDHAHSNPGTLKVTCAVTGRVVWEKDKTDG